MYNKLYLPLLPVGDHQKVW